MASVPQLEVLLKELPDINVDLSEFASKLKQAVRLYCLCRNPYRPPMIVCKVCRAQFHAVCVGHEGPGSTFLCLECAVSFDMLSFRSTRVLVMFSVALCFS